MRSKTSDSGGAAAGFAAQAKPKTLAPRHRQLLKVRAIDPGIADERGYWSEDKTRAAALGYRGPHARPGLVLPLHTVWGGGWGQPWSQLRPDAPPKETTRSGKTRDRKYLRPSGSPTVLDVHPRWLERLDDTDTPVAIVEGIPKADALTSIGVMPSRSSALTAGGARGARSSLISITSAGRGGRSSSPSTATRARTNMSSAPRGPGRGAREAGCRRAAGAPANEREAEGRVGRPPRETAREATGARGGLPARSAHRPRPARATAAPGARQRRGRGARDRHLRVAPYVPAGKLTVVDGDAGLGKTFLLLRLAAAMSNGERLPGGPGGEPVAVKRGKTLYFSMEDGIADTLVPRALALGVDPTALVLAQGFRDAAGNPLPFTFAHLEALEEQLRAVRPRLVVFDPLLGFLGPGVDSHKASETRPVLADLGRVAETHGVAIVGIRHTRKTREGRAVHAGLGTVDIGAAARSVLIVGKHPVKENVSVLAHTKSSTCRDGASLEFRIDDEGRLAWEGTSDLRADDLVVTPKRRGPAPRVRSEVEEWLHEALLGGGLPAREVMQLAKERGHSRTTVHQAADQLGVRKGERGSRNSTWRLPF